MKLTMTVSLSMFPIRFVLSVAMSYSAGHNLRPCEGR